MTTSASTVAGRPTSIRDEQDHGWRLQFFSTLLAQIDTRVARSAVIAAGDHVVEVGRTQGSAHATGKPVDVAEVHVWTVRGGKVARMEAYVHHPDMLAVLGLPG